MSLARLGVYLALVRVVGSPFGLGSRIAEATHTNQTQAPRLLVVSVVLPPFVRQQAAGERHTAGSRQKELPRRPQARGRCASQPPTMTGPCVGVRLGSSVPPLLEVDGGAERACVRVLRRPVMPAEVRVARRVPQVAQPERRRGGGPILGAADERRAHARARARASASAYYNTTTLQQASASASE